MQSVIFPRRTLFLIAIIVFAIGAVLAGRLYYGLSKDIYWTPMQHALAPSEARDRVTIYVGNKLISDSIGPENVSLRFNNRDRIARNTMAGIAFCLGIGVTLLGSAIYGSRRVNSTTKPI
jgi:hypothetical protein